MSLRAELIRLAHAKPELRDELLPLIQKRAIGWKNLPKGWTQDSVESFWGKLTGDVKHKVTKCIKRMEKHMGDGAGGFCASLADQVEGSTDWRKGPRKKKTGGWVSRDDVRTLCPSCADKMASLGMTKIRTAALQAAFERASRTEKLKIRNDLKPRGPRGRSTNPNTYGALTYYEVVALGYYEEEGGFGPHDKRLVRDYLRGEGSLEPGHQYGGHGTEYDNTLKWDPREEIWLLESRFSYLGG